MSSDQSRDCGTVRNSLLCVWRVFIHRMPQTTHSHHLRPIHPQRLDCCSASRRQTDQHCSAVAPGEMVGPVVLVRMKQRDILSR